MVHHEAGHLLLLYFYGWQIGRFTCRYAVPDWMGSIRNQRIANPPIVASAENLRKEAQKLLAGELAARVRMGLPTDQIVFPLDAPAPETLTAQTPLEDLFPPDDQRYDGIRALGRFVHNRHHLAESWWARTKLFLAGRSRVTWWTWIWSRHAEAHELLDGHWPTVEALAARLATVNADQLDPATGHMVNGDVLIQWCRQVDAPALNRRVRSVSF